VAHSKDEVRVTGHSDEVPFWWRWFDDSVEVTSDRLREAIVKDEAEQFERAARDR
jgi:hypothetical protein